MTSSVEFVATTSTTGCLLYLPEWFPFPLLYLEVCFSVYIMILPLDTFVF